MNRTEQAISDLFTSAARSSPVPAPNISAVYDDAVLPDSGASSAVLELVRSVPARRRFSAAPALVAVVVVVVALAVGATVFRSDDSTAVGSGLLPATDALGLAAADFVPLTGTTPPAAMPGEAVFERGYLIDGRQILGAGPVDPGKIRNNPEQFPESLPQPSGWVCLGSATSMGCGPVAGEQPRLTGITEGGEDVVGWAWYGVPADAALVVFTDHDGSQKWQVPLDTLVYFSDTISDPDGSCACTLNAYDASGRLLSSVDVQTASYAVR